MKQVIVVDESLRLPRGKLAAQVAHGSLAAFLVAGGEARRDWIESGMTKVVLAADAPALLALEERASAAGLPHALIRDAGRTLLPEGTVTCIGIGPAAASEVDPLTGALPLVD